MLNLTLTAITVSIITRETAIYCRISALFMRSMALSSSD